MALGIGAVAGGGTGEQTLAIVFERRSQGALLDAGDPAQCVMAIDAVVDIGVLEGPDLALQRVAVVAVMLELAGDLPGFCCQVALIGILVFAAPIAVASSGNVCAQRFVCKIGLQSAVGQYLLIHFDTGVHVSGLRGQLR
ncbi:hypothetical protein D3C76_1376270 [compost metagenome]